MKSLCIVSCGGKKIWERNHQEPSTHARNVYIGSFTKKCCSYAERFYPNCWYILSAKYGFLLPNDSIPQTYNITLNDTYTNPICLENLKKQVIEKNLYTYEQVVVMGGRTYCNIIKSVFTDKDIRTPLEGCKGIGYMLQKVNDALQNNYKL